MMVLHSSFQAVSNILILKKNLINTKLTNIVIIIHAHLAPKTFNKRQNMNEHIKAHEINKNRSIYI